MKHRKYDQRKENAEVIGIFSKSSTTLCCSFSGVMAFIGLIIVISLFSYLLSVFRSKYHGYPYRSDFVSSTNDFRLNSCIVFVVFCSNNTVSVINTIHNTWPSYAIQSFLHWHLRFFCFQTCSTVNFLLLLNEMQKPTCPWCCCFPTIFYDKNKKITWSCLLSVA